MGKGKNENGRKSNRQKNDANKRRVLIDPIYLLPNYFKCSFIVYFAYSVPSIIFNIDNNLKRPENHL